MSSFCTDSFTDTAGTLLESHTGETGATWTKNAALPTGGAAITAANRVRGNAPTTVYYASGTPSSPDYDVEADLYVQSSFSGAGLLGRQSATALTYYLFDYETGSGAWKLFTLLGGSNQNVTTYTQALTVGQTYRMRLSMRGSTITCYVNGVQIIQITDTNVTAAGKAGLFFADAMTDSTGLHLDNFSGAVPQTVAVTDANLFFSPYNWFSDGAGALQSSNVKAGSTYAESNTPGAYLKFNLAASTNGSVSLLLDTTPLSGITAGNTPMLAVSVDGAALATTVTTYATGVTRIYLAGNLAAGSHAFLVYFRSVGQAGSSASGDRWTLPASAVKVTGLELDGRGSATTAPTLRSKRMIAFGDSITEGVDSAGGTNSSADQDSTITYAHLVAAALDAEVGVIGFAAQGWTVGGYGNVPKFFDTTTPANSAFNRYWNGASRLTGGVFSPAPDYLTVLHGKNDAFQGVADASVTAAVSAWIAAARAAAPGTRFFVLPPLDGSKRSAVLAGVTAAADPKVYPLDLTTNIGTTLNSGGINTNDGIHPNARGHATVAALAVKQIQTQLTAATYAGSTGAFVGASVSLTDGVFAA